MTRKQTWIVIVVSGLIVVASLWFAWWQESRRNKVVAELSSMKAENESLILQLLGTQQEIGRLEGEIVGWREAAGPAWSIYEYELAHRGRLPEDLVKNGTWQELGLALRPCRYSDPERICTEAERKDPNVFAPVIVVPWRPLPGKKPG